MFKDEKAEFKPEHLDVDGLPPLIHPDHELGTIEDKIGDIPLQTVPQMPKVWFKGFGIAFLLLQSLFLGVTVLLAKGIGVWGLHIPVAWGFAIINFVWWIGIGHAGTLISAILFCFV